MSYKVRLQTFEGPLDLLLYLIKKDELDIHDIPIADITEQYLEYLNWLNMLDLAIAGEFLVMAATLMQIKSKMLLPQVEEDQETEEDDPRNELVRRLLEYKSFKEAAQELKGLKDIRKDVFTRRGLSADEETESKSSDKGFEASLFDLISAFAQILKEVPRESFHEIIKDEITVEQKVHELLHLLISKPRIVFHELFKETRTKIEIVATFLAVLELIRLKEIVVMQQDIFADIEVVRNDNKVLNTQTEDTSREAANTEIDPEKIEPVQEYDEDIASEEAEDAEDTEAEEGTVDEQAAAGEEEIREQI